MREDIIYQMLRFAEMNHGVFKTSSFKYIADPPVTWRQRQAVLQRCVDLDYFDRYRADGKRAYVYTLTPHGRDVLAMRAIA
jgi:hypothetical protein